MSLDNDGALKPAIVQRLKKSLATPKDKLLTSEQMGKKLNAELPLDTLAERFAEVRRRVIIDFFTGVSPDAPHYATCRLCNWTWVYGTAELHEPSCPMKGDA